MKATKEQIKELLYKVNGAAIEVHKTMGPGLPEHIYHECLKLELKHLAIPFESQINVPIMYKGKKLKTELLCDLFIDDMLVVKVNAFKEKLPSTETHMLTYMKLLGAPIGLTLNFNCSHLYKQGQKSYVNEIYRSLPGDPAVKKESKPVSEKEERSPLIKKKLPVTK